MLFCGWCSSLCCIINSLAWGVNTGQEHGVHHLFPFIPQLSPSSPCLVSRGSVAVAGHVTWPGLSLHAVSELCPGVSLGGLSWPFSWLECQNVRILQSHDSGEHCWAGRSAVLGLRLGALRGCAGALSGCIACIVLAALILLSLLLFKMVLL